MNQPQKPNDILDNLLKPLFKKRGFKDTHLIHDWRHIVGELFANMSHPLRIDFYGKDEPGVLRVSVKSAASLEFHHYIPEIIERINTYYGFMLIRDIKLFHNSSQK